MMSSMLKSARNFYMQHSKSYDATGDSVLLGAKANDWMKKEIGRDNMDRNAKKSMRVDPNYRPRYHGAISLDPDGDNDVAVAMKKFGSKILAKKGRFALNNGSFAAASNDVVARETQYVFGAGAVDDPSTFNHPTAFSFHGHHEAPRSNLPSIYECDMTGAPPPNNARRSPFGFYPDHNPVRSPFAASTPKSAFTFQSTPLPSVFDTSTNIGSKRNPTSTSFTTGTRERGGKRRAVVDDHGERKYAIPTDENCQQLSFHRAPKPYAIGTSKIRQAFRWAKKETSIGSWFAGLTFPSFGTPNPEPQTFLNADADVDGDPLGGEDFEILDHQDCQEPEMETVWVPDGDSANFSFAVELPKRVEYGYDTLADLLVDKMDIDDV
ncbi:hypothetical protein BDV96DRAFT_684654 [Lophiotrema nucula]|uniref:Uncharacterized protein n=1 Tax=Lophiotrema nucula TaxID=690887 RepID=A0A6A5ZJ31_9PLEO|nr:hypothetical protein BDV96DRAFT_684654 [Lophiotrema nucula]